MCKTDASPTGRRVSARTNRSLLATMSSTRLAKCRYSESKHHCSEALLALFCVGKPVVANSETTVATHCKHPGSQHYNYSKMNSTIEEQNGKGGSIAVYQRLLPGKRPAKVEVIRAAYQSIRAPDGKAFGRTNNTVLLRVTSGTSCLTADETAALRQCGLNEQEIGYVNQRLTELAGPASARVHEMDVADAKAKLEWIIALAGATPLVAKQVSDLVHAAAGQLDVDDNSNALEPDLVAHHEALANTLCTLNSACEQAQALYKRLPKGELPDDVVLKFQKSWFAYQDLLATLRMRKSMARPAGWSSLRAQIRAGHIYRKGQPIPE